MNISSITTNTGSRGKMCVPLDRQRERECVKERHSANENSYDNKLSGWRVTHTFSYKAKDGDSKNCTYVLFMDETFSRVIRYLDEDNITYDSYVEAVDKLLKNEFK